MTSYSSFNEPLFRLKKTKDVKISTLYLETFVIDCMINVISLKHAFKVTCTL